MDMKSQAPVGTIQDVVPTDRSAANTTAAPATPVATDTVSRRPTPAPVKQPKPEPATPHGSRQPFLALILACVCFIALTIVAYQAYLKTQ